VTPLTGGCSIFISGTSKDTCTFGGIPLRDHPPPIPPYQCSHPDQKGANLLLYILHPSGSSSRPETEVLQRYGAKTEIRTPVHTWPTRQPQLACTASHRFHFFRLIPSHDDTIVEVQSELLYWLDSPCGLHPSACTSDIYTCPPLLPKLLKKGGK
jgi:hypothetical protein